MSFDVFLQYAQREASPHTDLNGSVVRVVRAFGGGERDEYGYFFTLADGGSIELFFKSDDDGGMLALRGMSPMTVSFIRELLEATGWVALFTAETDSPLCAVATQAVPAEEVWEDFPAITVISTDAELFQLMSPGLGAWSDYRDQVTS